MGRFLMELVKELKIDVISDLAKQALELEQWGQACINGIKFFLPILRGETQQDPEYLKQKEALEKQYQEMLRELKDTYVFFHGRDAEYENVLKMENVQLICIKNKIKAEKADINMSSFKAFQNIINSDSNMATHYAFGGYGNANKASQFDRTK